MPDSAAGAEGDIAPGEFLHQVNSGELYLYSCRSAGEFLAQRKLLPLHSGGEETVMPDLRKPRRQDMEKKTPDKLIGGERHRLFFGPTFVIALLV